MRRGEEKKSRKKEGVDRRDESGEIKKKKGKRWGEERSNKENEFYEGENKRKREYCKTFDFTKFPFPFLSHHLLN